MLNKWIWLFLFVFICGQAAAGPRIQFWQTKNGAKVLFVEAPELPMVDIRLVFDAGGARDGDLPGVALLTNGLLAEGTKKMNADQIAEHFDRLGVQFGNSSLRDMAVVDMRSLSDAETLNKAVDVIADIIRTPSFPKQAFKRERNRLLLSIKARKQSPGDIAEEAFYQALYGMHPYHHMPEGTEQSIAKIRTSNLREFHRRHYVARNAVVAVVGALNKKAAETLVDRLIGRLPMGKKAAQLPAVSALRKATRTEVHHPSSQTHILVGQPGISRKDPDYFALYVGNHILGGSGLVSRISDEIREKRGLAYSSYSYFLPMRRKGPFQMGLQTRNDQSTQALKVLMETLKGFIEKGPTKEELEQAKKNLSGGFALRLDSNKKIADYLAVIGFYQLPADYLDTFVRKVEQVSLDQIKSAFQKRIQPEKLAVVVVGGGKGGKSAVPSPRKTANK